MPTFGGFQEYNQRTIVPEEAIFDMNHGSILDHNQYPLDSVEDLLPPS